MLESAGTASPGTAIVTGSIAVSARIESSRWMQILCGLMACVCLFVALTVLLISDNDSHLAVQIAVVATAIGAAALCIREIGKQRSCYDLHFSGGRDIHMATVVDQSVLPSRSNNSPSDARWLKRGSLITPIVLILRLVNNHGNINTVFIFPDSVSDDAFRRLSVTCRWLVTQKQRHQDALTK